MDKRERRKVYRDTQRPRCCGLLKLPFSVQCTRRASIQRRGKYYCGLHDPQRPTKTNRHKKSRLGNYHDLRDLNRCRSACHRDFQMPSFLEYWDPNEWELFVYGLLQDRHGPTNVLKAPARHRGDHGIDYYCLADRIAYQCYAVQEPCEVSDRAEKQKAKITLD